MYGKSDLYFNSRFTGVNYVQLGYLGKNGRSSVKAQVLPVCIPSMQGSLDIRWFCLKSNLSDEWPLPISDVWLGPASMEPKIVSTSNSILGDRW